MAVTGWRTTLSWNQFRQVDEAPDGSGLAAATAPLIEPPSNLGVEREGNLFRLNPRFTIRVRLVGQDSWVVNGQRTSSLLNHEQGHWDIAGLVAYEIDRSLRALRSNDVQGLRLQVQSTETRLRKKLDDLTKKYDQETSYGRIAQQQVAWDQQVANSVRNNNAPLPNP